MTQKKSSHNALVYSTNPQWKPEAEKEEEKTLLPSQQKLKVILDSKHRAGKIATCVRGFVGTKEDIAELGKALKNKCGTGGSVKDNEIIIQGDFKNKVIQILQQMHYNVS